MQDNEGKQMHIGNKDFQQNDTRPFEYHKMRLHNSVDDFLCLYKIQHPQSEPTCRILYSCE